MLLIVGLGNPGSKYENHRHNVGFMAVNEIVHRHNFSSGRNRWQSVTHEGQIAGTKIIAIKPQTFMNESGRAVGEAMRFYKLTPADVIVFYDELDLAFGKVKAKTGGGAAGHNGIRSIASHIGPDFTRIRIGIGHPGDKARVHSHVLGDFSKTEVPQVEKMMQVIADETSFITKNDLPRFMSQVALQLQPQRPSTGEKKSAGEKRIAKKPDGLSETTKPTSKKDKTGTKQSNEGPMAEALRALKNGEK